MPVLQHAQSLIARKDDIGSKCNQATSFAEWQVVACPHQNFDPGWVSPEPLVGTPAFHPNNGQLNRGILQPNVGS